MSPLDQTTITNKLAKLREIIKILQHLSKIPKQQFLKDPIINGSAKYYLSLGIEIITDIGNHVLMEAFQISQQSYRETILNLGKTKIIPQKFAHDNSNMAGFRNILTHDYMIIDLNQVYTHLKKAPPVFQKFAHYYLQFIEKI